MKIKALRKMVLKKTIASILAGGLITSISIHSVNVSAISREASDAYKEKLLSVPVTDEKEIRF